MTKHLAVLAATLLLPLAVAAAPKDGQQFEDWKTACETSAENRTTCHIFQRIAMKETGKQLLHIAVGYPKPGEPPVAVFTLPLGIALPPGLALKIEDGEPTRMPLTVCTADGCRAGLKLSEELIDALRRGQKAVLTFASIEAQAFNVPVSLKGFSAGLASVRP